MRKQTILGMIILSSFMFMAFTRIYTRIYLEPIEIESKDVTLFEQPIFKIPNFEINELDLFLDDIGFQESGNRYEITNRFGYMGKYQFGRKTLKNLGYDVSKKEFLNSPELQEQAMLDLLYHNKEILEDYIEYWDGKTINGIQITESGILAAAHLAGPSNVKKYFTKGKNFKDGNGTKLTSYLTKFSGYKLNLE